MPTRYLSASLPLLPTDRLRRAGRVPALSSASPAPARAEPAPLVTVGPVKGERRVMAACAAAAARGLRPGMALADARALCPAVLVAEADPDADAALLRAVVDWCGRFTPLSAPDGPDGAILDVGGVAQLFGGEAGLVEAVEGGLRRQGLTARATVASTPEAAWALARFGATRVAPAPRDPGFGPLAAALPVAALRVDAETVAGLARAGLARVGDLLMRPRAPIAARFGAGVLARLDGLMGRVETPITPHAPVPRCVAERRFADGLARAEQIEAALLPLCRHLCASLARRGQGARRIEASFFRVDGAVKRFGIGTSRPSREPERLMGLLREKLAAIGEHGLDTGYGFDLIRLSVVESERLEARQEVLAEDDPARALSRISWVRPRNPAASDAKDEQPFADQFAKGCLGDAMAELADRLGARLGLQRVLRLAPHDTHLPECAAVALPAARAAPPGAGDPSADLDALPCRPIRLFDPPEPIDTIAAVPDGPPVRFRWRRAVHEVAAIEGPERIAPAWWNGEAEPRAPAGTLTRDYFRAEDRDGRRFWLYREGLFGRETATPRWFLHGLFG